MSALSNESPLRLAILQRVCTGYRTALFANLSSETDIDMKLYIGEDIPNSKVKSFSDLKGIKFQRMDTRFIKFGKRILPWHVGLVKELQLFNPDVILCEGESHFLGYLQAIFYRYLCNKRVALIHWCFISLPGEPLGGRGLRSLVKGFFRRFFDAFLTYSSYSKECLLKLGQPTEKVFVSTNVGDTRQFIARSDALTESTSEARKKLKLPDRFTVLYLGTLEKNKRPDVMLDLAKETDDRKYNFVLAGSGALFEELNSRVKRERLSNVFLPGRVVDELPLYLRAANVLLIPGRGGIVISEAMAFELPVILHQTDSTEFDLIKNGINGFHLQSGSVKDFHLALETLRMDPYCAAEMGRMSRKLVKDHFTTDNMVEQIKRAAHFAKNQRVK
jgi:glycosyltransferase involved in cell wall biosynthesis